MNPPEQSGQAPIGIGAFCLYGPVQEVEDQWYPDIALDPEHLSFAQCGDDVPVEGIDHARDKSCSMPHVQGSDKEIHEAGREDEMQTHGVTVGMLRRDKQEKNVQGIEDGGFKVCPKRNSAEDVGIPEGDGVVFVFLPGSIIIPLSELFVSCIVFSMIV